MSDSREARPAPAGGSREARRLLSDDPRETRLTSPEPVGDDREFEAGLRPNSFDEFVGQDKVKENLRIFIVAALQRAEALDHVLLHGPPGLGKTTLANIIAKELRVGIRTTSGPVLERPGDLAGILTSLKARDVLFIDEIHRMNRIVEEHLYSAMEDFVLDIVIDSGPSARSYRVPLEPFTLIGATTRSGLLTSPMRARFGIPIRLDFYGTDDLSVIVSRSARILGTVLDGDGAREIASRSRGTPRIANRLLRRARDYAQVKGDGVVTRDVAALTLELLDVDALGLDDMDRRLLLAIVEKFGGGPVGLSNLAAVVGEEQDTLEEVYEPYLIKEGYIKRTPRGREATALAYSHLGLASSRKAEQMRLL